MLCNRDKHRRNTKVQTQPDDQAWEARIAIAAKKTQIIIKEQEIRQAESLPASQQTSGNLKVRFDSLGFDINPMAKRSMTLKEKNLPSPLILRGPTRSV